MRAARTKTFLLSWIVAIGWMFIPTADALAWAGPTTVVAEPSQTAPQQLTPVRGRTDCSYGDRTCNPCVSDVMRSVRAIEKQPRNVFRLRTREREELPPLAARLNPLTWFAHVQSVQRIPGVEGDDWLAVVRSDTNRVGGGGILLAKLGELSGHAGGAREPAATRATNQAVYFYPMEDTDHPGGTQMIGKTLLVSAECAKAQDCAGVAYVEAYDLTEPGAARRLQRLTLDGSQDEPWQRPTDGSKAYASTVAALQLTDGHYLLFVGDRIANRRGWFYRSDRPSLDSDTRWIFQQAWQATNGALPEADVWDGEYQNISLVTECGSGEVYLVAMGNPSFKGPFGAGRDVLHVYRLEEASDRSLHLRRVVDEVFDGRGACTFRAGSGVHVTAEGELGIYCSAHRPPMRLWFGDSELSLAEFAQ